MGIKNFKQYNEASINVVNSSDLKYSWDPKYKDVLTSLQKKTLSSFPLTEILEKHNYIILVMPGQARRPDAVLPTEEAASPKVIPFYVSIQSTWTKDSLDEWEGEGNWDPEMLGKPIDNNDPLEFTAWLPYYSEERRTMGELCLTYAKHELEIMKKSIGTDFGGIPKYWDRENFAREPETFSVYFKMRKQKLVNSVEKMIHDFTQIDNRLYQNSKLISEANGNEYGNNSSVLLRDFSNYKSGVIQNNI